MSEESDQGEARFIIWSSGDEPADTAFAALSGRPGVTILKTKPNGAVLARLSPDAQRTLPRELPQLCFEQDVHHEPLVDG